MFDYFYCMTNWWAFPCTRLFNTLNILKMPWLLMVRLSSHDLCHVHIGMVLLFLFLSYFSSHGETLCVYIQILKRKNYLLILI